MAGIFRRQGDGPQEGYHWRDGVYLCTVMDSFQADLLESKLHAENIPTQRKYIGSASYLEVVFGNAMGGEMEIYVPESCLEDAKNIIVPVDLDDCEQEEE